MVDDLTGLPSGLGFRLATKDDRDLLLALYGSTRAEELSVVPWTNAEKTAFIEMQFDAQDTSYRQTYPTGEFLVILRHGDPIGRLYLARLQTELRIIDIALLPAHRGKGLGSGLLRSIIERADQEGIPVTLHVEPWNPAKRLYERLGFGVIDQRGPYELMTRPPRRQLKTAS